MAQYHKVEQGEYLSNIARMYGFNDYTTIWNDAKNSTLKRKRKNPNVLLPGDMLFIPDKQTKHDPRGTGAMHRHQIKLPTMLLRLVLKDELCQPLANIEYELEAGDDLLTGQTDGEGVLEKQIPIGLETVKLKLSKPEVTWTLEVGHLDPIHDGSANRPLITGVQARLNNLGFDCGEVDGAMNAHTQAALRSFQEQVLMRPDATGELDSETVNTLQEMHGS